MATVLLRGAGRVGIHKQCRWRCVPSQGSPRLPGSSRLHKRLCKHCILRQALCGRRNMNQQLPRVVFVWCRGDHLHGRRWRMPMRNALNLATQPVCWPSRPVPTLSPKRGSVLCEQALLFQESSLQLFLVLRPLALLHRFSVAQFPQSSLCFATLCEGPLQVPHVIPVLLPIPSGFEWSSAFSVAEGAGVSSTCVWAYVGNFDAVACPVAWPFPWSLGAFPLFHPSMTKTAALRGAIVNRSIFPGPSYPYVRRAHDVGTNVEVELSRDGQRADPGHSL